MKKIPVTSFALAAVAIAGLVGLLVACGTVKAPQLSLFDLGPAYASQAGSAPASALPPLSIAEVNAPVWLDSQMMYFRLSYANDQQPRPYAGSRWTMPPAQLFGQRLKSRLSQAGGVVLAATDGAANVPLLRIDADEFSQNFDSPTASKAQISIRASVFNGRTLLAQKSFLQQAAAPSADAAGGAKALALASDALITDMMTWIAGLPIRKN